MGEESLPSLSSASDRATEQAIVALKKGAHLLKYGRRGKPKFCPVRLSMDEKFLIWYSGQEEKQLRLSTVTNVIHGRNTKHHLQLEKESQCLSLVYANGKCSLELICKDKVQAESWFIGLRAVVSRNRCKGMAGSLKKQRGAQSCINSPAAFMRRKQIFGLSDGKSRSSEVHSLSGSPAPSVSTRCTSDGDSFCSASNLSSVHNMMTPSSQLIEQHGTKNRAARSSTFTAHCPDSSPTETHILKDIYIWGEGAGGELLPKLLESTTMLDIRTISLGTKHAALLTNQGEVYCWGEGRRGRLGHKVDMDSLCPKIVDSLSGVYVNYISCSEHQTCALTLSGELYTWGDDYIDKHSHWLPHKLLGSLDGLKISSVACGEWHTAIVSASGRLFTYGDGTFGALGHGDLQSYSQPKEVKSIKNLRVETVACGPWHTAAVVDGKLFTWGDSDKGRLGHRDQERKLVPTYVAELFDHDFVQVSCGDTLTAGLTSTGRVYTMGGAVHGQLGSPQAKDKSIASVKGRLVDEFVIEMSSGSFHIAVLTSKGNVYTWGKGENGQLGLGDTKDRHSPSLVDTFRGRKVEKVTCGSNSTAAICAHKSLSSADQLACRGCGSAFRFTRKKHNCYNCGCLFCRACCSKRSMSASLAPKENKPFRVCNGCFNGGSKTNQAQSIGNGKYSYDGDRSSERKHFNIQGEKPQPPDTVYMDADKALPRWGHVSCPRTFMNEYGDPTMGSFPALEYESSSKFSVCLLEGALEVKSKTASPLNAEKESDRSRLLYEEILKLKAQVDTLEKLCQTREEKIQENRQKTREAWTLAREEATKCKEADELVQSLTSKLCKMSEQTYGGQETENKADDPKVPQTRMHRPVLAVSCTPTNVVQLKDSNSENLCGSPIVFSSKLRSSYDRDLHTRVGRSDILKSGTKCSKVEWVEQYQPGVFITLSALPDGQTCLRRVRFSREKFNEREAKRWWEENQQSVHQEYRIDGYSTSNS